jgi:hypothetical protein
MAGFQTEQIHALRPVELIVLSMVVAWRKTPPFQFLDIDAVAYVMMLVELALIKVTIGAGDNVNVEHGPSFRMSRKRCSTARSARRIPISRS